ncbi:MAG TPA: allophanate hydrolase subunit 1 [Microvirga sp.]|jgi:inhibitor of KinA
MTQSPATPIIRPVGDTGVLVEFGDRIDEAVHRRVLAFDAALAREPFAGFTESVPAFASVFVGYDPLVTDPAAVASHVEALVGRPEMARREPRLHAVEVCYEPPYAPDLPAVAERLGLTPEAVIAAHLAGEYQVYLYGFAPGYAYLGGVPKAIRLPRKPEPVRGVPAGSVIIAGPQCLVTTLTMPTGWWIIGRSPTRILSPQSDTPFLFEVGDRVRFTRVGAATLAQPEAAP